MTSKLTNGTSRLSEQLDVNVAYFRNSLQGAADFNLIELQLGKKQAVVMNLLSLVDSKRVHDELIVPLANNQPIVSQPIERPEQLDQIEKNILAGHTIVLFEGYVRALSVQISSQVVRAIEEPSNEYVERGPRDGFTESWQTNLGMIRRRIKSKDLFVQSYNIGTYTQTKCALLYIQGIAPDHLISQVRTKLDGVQLDALVDSSQLEAILQESTYSPFEQIENTERPDKVTMELLKGRMVVFVDTSPTALIFPTTLSDLIESTSDHYQRPLVATMRKSLRIFGFAVATYLSAIFLSLVLYHAHLIPIKFVQILTERRVKVPFPAWFEIFVMQVMIDLALEAIIRLPTRLGQIIGVAGAIVLGQAVIALNLIAPTVIVVVATTTVSGYVQPHLSTSFSISVMRYFNLILASILGLYGVMMSIMFWIVHLCGINPYHTPYLRPLSPLDWASLRDMIVKLNVPWVGSKLNARIRKNKGAANE